jgi:folylpolyglutamate synthase
MPLTLEGLAGKHQVQNATIAVELTRKFLNARQVLEDTAELHQTFIDGLRYTKWPGRCQTVADPVDASVTWYLDGAHTIESLDCCMDWFLSPGVGADVEDSSYVSPCLPPLHLA